MKTKFSALILCALVTSSVEAQFLSGLIKNNSQQLIDEALSGAFVNVTLSYNLCDTVSNKRFGRDSLDYFNKVTFIGIKTNEGIIVEENIEQPWDYDPDFQKYKGKYKPLLLETTLSDINVAEAKATTHDHLSLRKVEDQVYMVDDSECGAKGLVADYEAGEKKGWFVWLSPSKDDENSLQLTSVNQTITAESDGKPTKADKPTVMGTVLAGIFVTPVQTAIGQITLQLTGYVLPDGDDWTMHFPFVGKPKMKALTPIEEKSATEENTTTTQNKKK